jgi:hypothetical protein
MCFCALVSKVRWSSQVGWVGACDLVEIGVVLGLVVALNVCISYCVRAQGRMDTCFDHIWREMGRRCAGLCL